jgi:hypothetical protein
VLGTYISADKDSLHYHYRDELDYIEPYLAALLPFIELRVAMRLPVFVS